MAECGEQTTMTSSFSQLGSEEDFNVMCQPCERDNQRVEGMGYCKDCNEYLCETCFKYHKKILVSRDHTLLGIASMKTITRTSAPALPPKTKRREHQTESKNPLTRDCPKHQHEFTKFFCNFHNSLACSVCLSLDHRNCEDVSYIPDVSENIQDSEEFKQVFGALKKLQSILTFENQRGVYKEKRLAEIYSEALSDILQFRENINKRLDELCAAIEQELAELHKSEQNRVTKWIRGYNGLRPDIDKTVKSFEEDLSRGNLNKLYIEMKLLKEKMNHLEDKVKNCTQNNTIMQYKFEGNTDFTEKLSAIQRIGHIQTRINEKNVTIKPLHDINVKSELDVQDCNINGAIVLSNGDVAVSDHHNKSIKIIIPCQNTISSQLLLDSEPFDLALVSDDTLAVTLPNNDNIQLLKMSANGLSKHRTLKVTMTCVGIECKDDTLIVSCQDPGCVRLLDLNGRVLRTINKDVFGRSLFTKPRTIALSVDKSVVYVTDWDKGCVCAVSLEGELVALHQSNDLKRPLGMACDSEGMLYVCYGDTHNVQQMTSSLTTAQTLLHKTDGLAFPWAIALDKRNDRLYIGSVSKHAQHRNKIRVFQLQHDYV